MAGIIPLLLATICLIFELYNPTPFLCYVITYPVGCDHYPDIPCIRGNHTWMWRSVAQIVSFSICMLTIICSVAVIYKTVREQERAMAQYSSEWVQRRARNSRLALHKAAVFIGAFLVVWTPALLVALCEDLGVKIPFPIWLIDAFMIPRVCLLCGRQCRGIRQKFRPIGTKDDQQGHAVRSSVMSRQSGSSLMRSSELTPRGGHGTSLSRSFGTSGGSSSHQFRDEDGNGVEDKEEEEEQPNTFDISVNHLSHDENGLADLTEAKDLSSSAEILALETITTIAPVDSYNQLGSCGSGQRSNLRQSRRQ